MLERQGRMYCPVNREESHEMARLSIRPAGVPRDDALLFTMRLAP